MAQCGRIEIIPYGSKYLVSRIEYVPIVVHQKEFCTKEEAEEEAKRLKGVYEKKYKGEKQ